MKAIRTLGVVTVLLAVGAIVIAVWNASRPLPQPVPASPSAVQPTSAAAAPQIDPTVVEVWTRAGFELVPANLHRNDLLPTFRRARPGATLTGLPDFNLPFALELTAPAVGELKHLVALEHLTSLKLSGKDVTDGTLAHLGSLPGLTTLALSETSVKGSGLRQLRGFTKLTLVYLSEGQWSDEALDALAAAGLLHTLPGATGPGWRRTARAGEVISLSLRSSQVTNAGLKHLREFPNLASLSLVSVVGVTDAGVEHLAKMTNLVSLDLRGTQVTPTGLKGLAPCKKLTLVSVEWDGRGLDGAGQTQSSRRLPTPACSTRYRPSRPPIGDARPAPTRSSTWTCTATW